MIRKGDKFKVHWAGHTCYEGRIYQVTSIIHDFTCPNPNCFVNGKPEVPRRPHAHIRADLIKCPYPQMEMRDFIFNGIDEETLIDIENSTYHLEIVREKGDQLSLF